MKIVHIGSGTTESEIKHIVEQRDAGHDYFVPGELAHEQTVRRIMDADEIHVWDINREFELGMVCFFAVHVRDHELHWRIRIFDDRETPYSAWFRHQEMLADRDRLVESIRIGEAVFMPVPVNADQQLLESVRIDDKLELHCDAEGSCEDCAVEEECWQKILEFTPEKLPAVYKRSYTRDDLTHEDEGTYGGVREICSLCYADAYSGVAIAHDVDCPLADPGVLGVILTSFRGADNGTTRS